MFVIVELSNSICPIMEFLRFYMQEETKDGFRPTVADTAFQHQ